MLLVLLVICAAKFVVSVLPALNIEEEEAEEDEIRLAPLLKPFVNTGSLDVLNALKPLKPEKTLADGLLLVSSDVVAVDVLISEPKALVKLK